jgi:YgiT-type zinc finger domain-containing protein
MICVICHGREIEVREAEEELTVGADVVFVPIRVPVCGTCGERYYDRKTMQYLEGVEKALRGGDQRNTREVGRVLRYG